jgi:hypothetical protein
MGIIRNTAEGAVNGVWEGTKGFFGGGIVGAVAGGLLAGSVLVGVAAFFSFPAVGIAIAGIVGGIVGGYFGGPIGAAAGSVYKGVNGAAKPFIENGDRERMQETQEMQQVVSAQNAEIQARREARDRAAASFNNQAAADTHVASVTAPSPAAQTARSPA